jgi:hypothetical protein
MGDLKPGAYYCFKSDEQRLSWDTASSGLVRQ